MLEECEAFDKKAVESARGFWEPPLWFARVI
jgi:hypothetical protein